MKPRAWADPEGCSSTVVLYDPRGPSVFMNTNLGWIGPVTVELEGKTLEERAQEIGEGYELEEVREERAKFLAAWPEEEADE